MVVLTANAVVGAKEAYLKDGFDDYLSNYLDYQTFVKEDDSALADFGTYMNGYEE